MRSSYKKEDVEILLKDITGLVQPQSTQERERFIQAGKHYCEMLPIEYSPSEVYREAYQIALGMYAKETAVAIGVVAEKIIEKKGEKVVLVSLARAGIPVGILIKHYLFFKYKIDIPHYAISIIRGRGIDKNALQYILKRHEAENIQFVDGWIGKGAILKELEKEMEGFPKISAELAVATDPANVTELCGTHEDILIPSSCFNCTVSGLISRTFLRDDIIKENDFHGAVYYEELEKEDISYSFIKTIEKEFTKEIVQIKGEREFKLEKQGIEEVKEIAEEFSISDINFIKPGIGETTRVLLRRVPWKVLINENYKEDSMINHILRLAKEKNVPIVYYPLRNYKACGIIRKYIDA